MIKVVRKEQKKLTYGELKQGSCFRFAADDDFYKYNSKHCEDILFKTNVNRFVSLNTGALWYMEDDMKHSQVIEYDAEITVRER